MAEPLTYNCPNNHEPTSLKAITKCPVAWCQAPLKRTGKGSRGPYKKGAPA